MIYWQLFISFFKIGLFSFGGGYGMIPLIEREITAHGWVTAQEFVNIISISEMTPGPIAINTATFIGFSMAGIPGGMLATFGVVLPSLILILIASHFLNKFKDHDLLKSIIWGIKPIVVALIISAVVFVSKNALLKEPVAINDIFNLEIFKNINFAGLGILILSLLLILKVKINPIFTILISAVVGILLYYLKIF